MAPYTSDTRLCLLKAFKNLHSCVTSDDRNSARMKPYVGYVQHDIIRISLFACLLVCLFVCFCAGWECITLVY